MSHESAVAFVRHTSVQGSFRQPQLGTERFIICFCPVKCATSDDFRPIIEVSDHLWFMLCFSVSLRPVEKLVSSVRAFLRTEVKLDQ